MLYMVVPVALVNYFVRLGFAVAGFEELVRAFGQSSMAHRARSNEAQCAVVRLDISRDGIIQR
jgi:hypothetical protein